MCFQLKVSCSSMFSTQDPRVGRAYVFPYLKLPEAIKLIFLCTGLYRHDRYDVGDLETSMMSAI